MKKTVMKTPDLSIEALPFAPGLTPIEKEKGVRLTREFVELNGPTPQEEDLPLQLQRGRILREGEPLFRRNHRIWVREHLRVPKSTAANYSNLAQFAEEEPDTLEKWKDLGISKLYEVCRMLPEERKQLFKDHARKVQELIDMGTREFRETVQAYRGGARPSNLLKEARRQTSRLESAIESLEEAGLTGIEDPGALDDLKERFQDAARRLQDLAGDR